ncbi:MAG: hypothetical protein ACKVXR_13870, partial [Planctomycetota bacterium]
VVNHVSDSVSIVRLSTRSVVATLKTDDEPCDVVFGGTPARAFVSCSQANTVLVYDLASLSQAPTRIAIDGEDPRAMAVSGDGTKVYVAVFESGNSTTILGGGGIATSYPPNAVNDPTGPYAGVNPPPNQGNSFSPPVNPANPPPPPVGLIVRKNAAGQWMDDNQHDWTSFVTGVKAPASGRPVGWDLSDNDVAVIDSATLAVAYARRLMNLCMAIAVNPANGQVTVVGTEATNEVRFEPVLKGKFTRVELARVDPSGPAGLGVTDLNPHLTYALPTVPQAERERSIGDPRGIVWNVSGTKGYVTGMGSNNVIVIDAAGARAGLAPTIDVGEGPTGIALDAGHARLFVLNKFEGNISVIDLGSETETARISFHDSSPAAIRIGRKHLYDTHKNSGLGQIACASCHIDGRMDRLSWDLGDPSGDMKSLAGQNLGTLPGQGSVFQPWHPMKGPMTTQTLQDIIGKEPLHWRGDRAGIEEFNGAFIGLQGDDANLTAAEMAEFEDFLATITYPPNPFRKFNNALPTDLPLPGHKTTGRFRPPGLPLPNGNARNGLLLYRSQIDGVLSCAACHTLPTGAGSDHRVQGGVFVPFPLGPNGENHLALVASDGLTNVTLKTPQLRNLYEKVGFDATQLVNRSGFGLQHDGAIDSIARFMNSSSFDVQDDQETADLVAFMLAFSGSELPEGSTLVADQEPPGPPSRDTHAAVGTQTTLRDASSPVPGQLTLIGDMIAQANTSKVGLVVKGVQGGIPRGYAYVAPSLFQSDRAGELVAAAPRPAAATPGSELTYTVVPRGTATRLGIDRDLDGCLDQDEIDGGSDPADPSSRACGPGISFCAGDGTLATACPCANAGVAGRGCANSQAGSAGAWLSARGATSPDTVVFTSSGELPDALSIVLQGTIDLGPGVPYGDGVRCVGGTLKRLYTKNAVSGVVTAPGPGDPSVTTRSAAAGDPIAPGSTRFYQAYYRDPAHSFCPSPSGETFNVSNGYRIPW